jgi:carbon-monoxide dehydrogenase large subunit
LKHCGALVTTAGTVNEAHRLLALLRPHVLVTDTGIPQDRLGLVRAAQALAQAHGVQIPTIAMTYDHGEQAEFWAAGVAEGLGEERAPGGGPDGACDETVSTPSFPYGCAVCEVEVDPETGVVEVVRYTSVDDVGRAINPLIVDGQTHGGIAQGLGQALWEHCRYDAASGQLQSATFMEYAMPRADCLPSFTTEISEVPAAANPLGLRGGGEGGTTPALGAAVNAIVDALADLGVEHLEMPVTPERVWGAIREAQRGRAASQSWSGGTRAST